MPLEEFINLPDTVSLHIKYDDALLSFVKDRDYIRVGKVAAGDKAVIYVRGDKINDVLQELGGNNTDYVALTLGLLGTKNIEAARNFRSSAKLKFKRQRSINRFCRYRNRLHKRNILK